MNKYWKSACEHEVSIEYDMNLNDLSVEEVISVGVIWSSVEILCIEAKTVDVWFYDEHEDKFNAIAKHFPNLRELYVTGAELTLMEPSLHAISRIQSLVSVNFTVYDFSGIMAMANLANLEYMYAYSAFSGCEFEVDKYDPGDYLLTEDYMTFYYLKVPNHVVDVFSGFSPEAPYRDPYNMFYDDE